MKRRRVKKKVWIIIGGFVLFLILSISLVNRYKYTHSTIYKLLKVGYSKEDAKVIIDKNIKVDIALKEYSDSFIKFISSKYFIANNLEKYLEYYKKNKNIDVNKIVSFINVGRDKAFYTDTKVNNRTDNLILVNKYNGFDSEFVPSDLVDVNIKYAYAGHQIRTEVNDQFVVMAKAALKENIKLIINSSYRSFKDQDKTYNILVNSKGKKEADVLAARPGYSEHQSGLAIDVTTNLEDDEEFINTEAFTWLKNNSYKYGFILRYPSDKEDITGYSYEPWHYRYVGIDVAKKIYNENITFDEYYAYYIDNK